MIYYNLRSKTNWLHFLELMKYTPEKIEEFEQYDEERKRLDYQEEKYYKEKIVPEVKKQEFEFIREIEKEMPEEIIAIKEEKKKELTEKYLEIIKDIENAVWGGKEASSYLTESCRELLKQIKKLQTEIDFLNSRDSIKEGLITEQDIVRAKNYPFDTLIETKRGFCKCPFHQEKSASFYIKDNFGYCFGCGYSADTIQFVMDTKGLDFIKAVKMLS